MHLSFASALFPVLLLLPLVVASPTGSWTNSGALLDCLGHITSYLDPNSASNLLQSHSEIEKRCGPLARQYYYIRDTPSFMQAVKRCMQKDDVNCFKLVKQYFERLEQVKDHHLAQLPQLAAKLNALAIFLTLDINQFSHKYRRALIRSYTHRTEKFFSALGDIEPIQSQAYHALDPVYHSTETFSFFLDPEAPFSYLRRYFLNRPNKDFWPELFEYYRQNSKENPEDWHFVLEQKKVCPSILNITEILSIKNIQERRESIIELKEKIVGLLKEGDYIVDDILLNPDNTVYLWWKYSKTPMNATSQAEKDDDGGASDFVQWLIDEGAPMNDISLMTYYVNGGYMTLESHKPKFQELVRVWSRHVSGGPTFSLIRFFVKMGIVSKNQEPWILPSLELYKSIGANVFEGTVLSMIALHIVSNYEVYPKYLGDRNWQNYTLGLKKWYVDNGLQMKDLDALKDHKIEEKRAKPQILEQELWWMIQQKKMRDRRQRIEAKKAQKSTFWSRFRFGW